MTTNNLRKRQPVTPRHVTTGICALQIIIIMLYLNSTISVYIYPIVLCNDLNKHIENPNWKEADQLALCTALSRS